MPNGRKHTRYRPVKHRRKAPAAAPQYGLLYTGCPAVELAIERLYQADDSAREDRFWGLIRSLNYALQMQTRVLVPVQMHPDGQRAQFSWAEHPIPAEKAAGLDLWTLNTPKGQKLLPVFTTPEQADGSPVTLGLPMAELPLQQVMEDTLAAADRSAVVVNPWGRSAALDKSILRGLLHARSEEDAPGEAEVRQGRQLACDGEWGAAWALFEAGAAQGSAEALRRMAYCCDNGLGAKRDRRRALSLWKKAAAAGDVLAQVALGDRLAAGTARTPADPGGALMAYRRARAMAETEMDITTWPVICLRMARAEARATDPERAGRLLAEAVHGLHLLCQEEADYEAAQELKAAVQEMDAFVRQLYAGASDLQELLQRLAEQLNTESLQFS